jgi:hypothetical protein
MAHTGKSGQLVVQFSLSSLEYANVVRYVMDRFREALALS